LITRDRIKVVSMVLLIITACFLIYYFHAVLKTDMLFTHVFYIPIILAVLWWREKGIAVSLIFAFLLILSHFLLPYSENLIIDCIRTVMFNVIAIVVYYLSEKLRNTNLKLETKKFHLESHIKHMNFLSDISKNIDNFNSISQITGNIVNIMPSVYPCFHARLLLNEHIYESPKFLEDDIKYKKKLCIGDNLTLSIEFFYSEKTQSVFARPFQDILEEVVSRIEEIIRYKKAEIILKETESQLKESKIALEQKTIVFNNIIEEIETEKIRLHENIKANISKSLLPVIKKLPLKGTDQKIIDVLEDNIRNITSSYGVKLSPSLTHREIEVCNMIKSGMSTKEISGLLNISFGTIETYRNSIRRKLGLVNSDTNLYTYLNSSN